MTDTSPDPTPSPSAGEANPTGAELDPQTAAEAGVLDEVTIGEGDVADAGSVLGQSVAENVGPPAGEVGALEHSNLPGDLTQDQRDSLVAAGTVEGPGAVAETETVELEVDAGTEPGDTIVDEDGTELEVLEVGDDVEQVDAGDRGVLTRGELEELTNDDLLDLGQDLGVHVTTHMTKAELVEAIVAGPPAEDA